MSNAGLLALALICSKFLLVFVVGAKKECDLEKYQEWREQRYQGVLGADPDFWRYQTQTEFVLTNALALDLAVASCVNDFDLLYYYLAGRMGPIDIQHSYKIMCREVCLESDRIHQDAMDKSGCSCLELSTQPGDQSYHIEGDFCLHNTARLLCDKVGYCGIWDCRLDDFMCPRYEWNKKYIRLKGLGTCENSAGRTFHYSSASAGIIVSIILVTLINIFMQ